MRARHTRGALDHSAGVNAWIRRLALRLTFLQRFTLLMLVVSTLSAFTLAYGIESVHRRALVSAIEDTAFLRAEVKLAPALQELRNGVPPRSSVRADFAGAAADAELSAGVTGLRVFRSDGASLYPARMAPQPAAVHAALAAGDTVSVDRGGTITAYAPFGGSGGPAYAIAVDLSNAQIEARSANEGAQITVLVIATVTVICLSLVTLAAGASRELERRRREAGHTFAQTLQVMADTIEFRDPYTAGHSRRVATYSRLLAEALGFEDEEIRTIENGALLHDIGKIVVPDRVLFKPAMLDRDERAIIETHPAAGAQLCADLPSMEGVTSCIRHHHERMDGSGYPDRLRGLAIPAGARVIAVADTFDAMTTDRPYRRALSVSRAVDELLRVAGSQLDAEFVATFVRLIVAGDVVLLKAPAAEAEFPVFSRKLQPAV